MLINNWTNFLILRLILGHEFRSDIAKNSKMEFAPSYQSFCNMQFEFRNIQFDEKYLKRSSSIQYPLVMSGETIFFFDVMFDRRVIK